MDGQETGLPPNCVRKVALFDVSPSRAVAYPRRVSPGEDGLAPGRDRNGCRLRMTSLSIKTRVTVIVTSAFVGLLALFSAIQMQRVKAEIAEVVGAQQLSLVSRVAAEIDDKLATNLRVMEVASQTFPSDAVNDIETLQKLLDSRAILRSIFDSIFVVSVKGVVLADSPRDGRRGIDISGQENFQQTVSTRKPYLSRPFRGKVSGQPIVTVSAPIFDANGEIVAILTGSLNLLKPNVLGSLATAKVGKTGWFSLIGRDRTVVVSRNADRIMTDGPPPGTAPYYDHATAGQEGWEIGKSRRSPLAVFSYKPLKSAPWVLVAALPVDEAFAPAYRVQKQIAAVGLAFTLLFAPLIWFGTRRLLDPLLALRDGIHQIRANPDSAARVPIARQDEIGDLASDFNALIEERQCAEAALRENEQRLRTITDNVPALIGYVDADGRYRYGNAAYHEWFGISPEQLSGRPLSEVLGEHGYIERKECLERAFSGRLAELECTVAHPDGTRHTHARYIPDVRDSRVVGIYILATDITALKRSEKLLQERGEQLSLALEGSQLALFDWNIETGAIYLSEQWAVILGLPPAPTRTTFAELTGLIHSDDVDGLIALLRDTLRGTISHYRAEHRVRNDAGQWLWIQSHGRVIERDATGRALRLVGTNADISERKRIEQALQDSAARLEHMARHDSLTGLPTRAALHERLQQALARGRRSQQATAVLYLDMDRFKSINDTLGHGTGDLLLRLFAQRLKSCVRETDTVARLGGDEFVIVMEGLASPADAETVARKILEAMRPVADLGKQRVQVSTSIGVAIGYGDADVDALLASADGALYAAKKAGRNAFAVAPAAPRDIEAAA